MGADTPELLNPQAMTCEISYAETEVEYGDILLSYRVWTRQLPSRLLLTSRQRVSGAFLSHVQDPADLLAHCRRDVARRLGEELLKLLCGEVPKC